MKLTRTLKLLLVLAVFALVAALLVGGAALAQNVLPATEGGPVIESAPSNSQADGPDVQPAQAGGPAATEGDAPQPAAAENPRLYIDGQAPDDNPVGLMPGEPGAPGATFSYYMVPGATLRGRASSTGTAYDGLGCIHTTSGSGTGRIVNTELILPNNAIIKYLRVYYRDTDAANNVAGYVTRYTPGQAANDLVTVNSGNSFSGGYGFAVSGEITQTVNNTSYAYTLIAWPSANSANVQICGLRVAYYAPAPWALFLPTVRR